MIPIDFIPFTYAPDYKPHQEIKGTGLRLYNATDQHKGFALWPYFNVRLGLEWSALASPYRRTEYEAKHRKIVLKDLKGRIRKQSMRLDLIIEDPRRFEHKVEKMSREIDRLAEKEKLAKEVEFIEINEATEALKMLHIFGVEVTKRGKDFMANCAGYRLRFAMEDDLPVPFEVSLSMHEMDRALRAQISSRIFNWMAYQKVE